MYYQETIFCILLRSKKKNSWILSDFNVFVDIRKCDVEISTRFRI